MPILEEAKVSPFSVLCQRGQVLHIGQPWVTGRRRRPYSLHRLYLGIADSIARVWACWYSKRYRQYCQVLHVGQPSVTVVGVGELLFGKASPAGRTVQTIYPKAYADQISSALPVSFFSPPTASPAPMWALSCPSGKKGAVGARADLRLQHAARSVGVPEARLRRAVY